MAGKSSVGKRIRTFREERNVDLETLSQNTGLTVNFLERMENDEIYPTIGPLQKVARSLGVRLGTFLDDQFTRDPIISRIDQLGSVDPALHTGRTPRSSYIYQALGKGKSDRNMEPFFIEIYPDKDDLNRFFSTLKQSMDNIENVRMELAHKYYALAETQPDLKVDLFSSGAQDIDLNRIQRVSVFKTKQEGTLCVATIDGKKLQPRSVTRQQWQRMWVAEDRAKYKCHLAATLFADVLRKGQTQEESAGKKQGEEDTQQQDKDKNPKQTAGEAQKAGSSLKELSIKDMPEQLYGKYEQIKEEQPEAVVLFKHGNNYYASMYDAETIANELNLPPSKERVPYDANKIVLVFEHDNEETRQQIHALRAYVMDCDGMSKAQQNGPAETTDEENEQRPTMRR